MSWTDDDVASADWRTRLVKLADMWRDVAPRGLVGVVEAVAELEPEDLPAAFLEEELHARMRNLEDPALAIGIQGFLLARDAHAEGGLDEYAGGFDGLLRAFRAERLRRREIEAVEPDRLARPWPAPLHAMAEVLGFLKRRPAGVIAFVERLCTYDPIQIPGDLEDGGPLARELAALDRFGLGVLVPALAGVRAYQRRPMRPDVDQALCSLVVAADREIQNRPAEEDLEPEDEELNL